MRLNEGRQRLGWIRFFIRPKRDALPNQGFYKVLHRHHQDVEEWFANPFRNELRNSAVP